MRRMLELVNMVIETHPNDGFFDTLNEGLRISSQIRANYKAYDRALSYLDPESWNVLSKKAIEHFRNHRTGQLKQGFFNQLNEAFAYQFLIRQGYEGVSVLPENGATIPDLTYIDKGIRHYCEVKTIGVSKEELDRRAAEESFDCSIYQELSEGFLNKLDCDLRQAHRQISSQSGLGLVFVIANFDDFTLLHYDRYQEQIAQFLSSHEVEDVFIKIGLIGGRRIHKQAGRLLAPIVKKMK